MMIDVLLKKYQTIISIICVEDDLVFDPFFFPNCHTSSTIIFFNTNTIISIIYNSRDTMFDLFYFHHHINNVAYVHQPQKFNINQPFLLHNIKTPLKEILNKFKTEKNIVGIVEEKKEIEK